eukprot:8789473-Pyramimonas_sp.AAC.1
MHEVLAPPRAGIPLAHRCRKALRVAPPHAGVLLAHRCRRALRGTSQEKLYKLLGSIHLVAYLVELFGKMS